MFNIEKMLNKLHQMYKFNYDNIVKFNIGNLENKIRHHLMTLTVLNKLESTFECNCSDIQIEMLKTELNFIGDDIYDNIIRSYVIKQRRIKSLNSIKDTIIFNKEYADVEIKSIQSEMIFINGDLFDNEIDYHINNMHANK